MKRVLLLLPTASYRNEAFIAAGEKLGAEMITAADYCHQLAPEWGLDPIMAVHFDRPGEAIEVDCVRSSTSPTPCWRSTTWGWSLPHCLMNA